MGTYISAVAQKKDPEGSFTTIKKIFDFQSYDVFAWLAGVKNLAQVTPLSPPRGLPNDLKNKNTNSADWFSRDSYEQPLINQILEEPCELSCISWFTVEELLAVDYDQIVLNRRNNGFTDPLPINESVPMKLRDFLGQAYMDDLQSLKEMNADRVLFAFIF